ncbi:ankyrin repeat domain-containing protein [bacterium]|nr:ankyrin repeat domain-containing protein [bacterium]
MEQILGRKEQAMLSTHEFIDAIKSGDANRLADLFRSSDNHQQRLNATITDLQPTDYSIGGDMTLLQFASFRSWNSGDPAAVLIDHGAKVDLHSACGLGMTDRIAEILAVAPDAIHDQVDSYAPIQFAISGAQSEAIECLIEHGDDPDRDLRKVAYFGWEDETREQHYTPWKPIHMASLWGFDSTRVPVSKSLAMAGADLNAISPLDGFRPIHLVAMPNRVDMIRFLVSQGVDVDSRTEATNEINLPNDSSGPIEGHACTPLMVAAAEGFVEATACLLELGADPKAENDMGHTAIDLASNRFWKGQPYDEIIDMLV